MYLSDILIKEVLSICYSTILYADNILPVGATDCQNKGLCIGGSYNPVFSYKDPGYCQELIDCPRLYPSSSPAASRGVYTHSFQGSWAKPRSGYVLADQQRPVLHKRKEYYVH